MIPHRNRFLCCLGLLILVTYQQEVLGWWDSGHRIIAMIAYEQLSQEQRLQISDTLRKHPRFKEDFIIPEQIGEASRDQWIFTQAAIWSDRIRRTNWDRPQWHYVNLPFYLNEDDPSRLVGKMQVNVQEVLPENVSFATEELNVIQAINLCVTYLKDPKRTPSEQAVFLCWLFHLVGDIHQPCHSTAIFSAQRFMEGDRGGNRIPLKRGRNLHRLWDSLLGESRVLDSQVRRRAEKLLSNETWLSHARNTQGLLEPAGWADESHRLARVVAYHPVILEVLKKSEQTPREKIPSIALPDSYYEQIGQIAAQRAVQAGFRLARLLEQIELARNQTVSGR